MGLIQLFMLLFRGIGGTGASGDISRGGLFPGRGERATVRHIQDTPRSKVATAPQGLVEVEGFAWPESELDTTLSGLEAVYRSLCLQREDTEYDDGKRRRVWKTVGVYSTGRPFYIVDETGLALVDLTGVDINTSSARTTAWRAFNKAQQARVIECMPEAIHGFPPGNFLFGLFAKKFRVIESEILLGSPLYVRGVFQTPEGSEHKVRSQGLTGFCERVFDLEGRARKNLDRTIDINKDGKVSETESRQFYTWAARAERLKAGNDKTPEREFGVSGILKSNETHRLLLADAHETHLIARMKSQWRWRVAAAVAIATVVIFQIRAKVQVKAATYRTPASQQAPQQPVASLHEACVAGEAAMCDKLLDRTNLPEANAEYYRARACALGLTKHCR